MKNTNCSNCIWDCKSKNNKICDGYYNENIEITDYFNNLNERHELYLDLVNEMQDA